MKKWKMIMLISVLMLLGLLGIVNWGRHTFRVRFSEEGDPVGFILKDETESVEAVICLGIYNGTWEDKTIVFDVDGGDEFLEGQLENEKYEVIDIEILRGNGQIDMENMTLSIPSREGVTLRVEAKNTYVGSKYQGERVFLRRKPPNINFVVID